MLLGVSILLASQLSAVLALPTDSLLNNNRVLYFLDNDPAGNSIVSVKISEQDGTLSSPVRTATGGNGLPQLAAVSQDSVTVSGNYLFTTNAGSNTLSMFVIDPHDPMRLQLVGKPASTLGHIPVSVTYSKELNIACAANAGNIAGVACFSVDPRKGLENLGPLRFIPQPTNSTPPAVGPLTITGDITFNPSSSAVFTTVASTTDGAGFLYAYPVFDRQVSHTPVINTLKDLTVPFSLNFLGSDSQLFVTNPHNGSPGAASLHISYDLTVANIEIITIPGQEASCWVANVPAFDTLFVMDAARPVISILDSKEVKVESQFGFTPPFGAMDTKADRHYLYALTAPFGADFTLIASPQILVYDFISVQEGKTPKQIQSFDIFSTVGRIPDLMGLAIYPSY